MQTKSPSKRGRPLGSKKIKVTKEQIAAYKAVEKASKPVDWEKLAKNLQVALAKEIKEHEECRNELKISDQVVLMMSGIVKYLEIKNGNHSV